MDGLSSSLFDQFTMGYQAHDVGMGNGGWQMADSVDCDEPMM